MNGSDSRHSEVSKSIKEKVIQKYSKHGNNYFNLTSKFWKETIIGPKNESFGKSNCVPDEKGQKKPNKAEQFKNNESTSITNHVNFSAINDIVINTPNNSNSCETSKINEGEDKNTNSFNPEHKLENKSINFKEHENNNCNLISMLSTSSNFEFCNNNLLDKRKWTSEEDKILLDSVKTLNCKNWKKISEIIGNKTPQQCSYRYQRLIKLNTEEKWVRSDEIKLMDLIEFHGLKWDLISKEMKKSVESCEERYYKKLDPFLKRSKFTEEEDNLIIFLLQNHGNNWNEIAKYFPDRNALMIRNRYYSSLRKEIPKIFPDFKEIDSINTSHFSNYRNSFNKISLNESLNRDIELKLKNSSPLNKINSFSNTVLDGTPPKIQKKFSYFDYKSKSFNFQNLFTKEDKLFSNSQILNDNIFDQEEAKSCFDIEMMFSFDDNDTNTNSKLKQVDPGEIEFIRLKSHDFISTVITELKIEITVENNVFEINSDSKNCLALNDLMLNLKLSHKYFENLLNQSNENIYTSVESVFEAFISFNLQVLVHICKNESQEQIELNEKLKEINSRINQIYVHSCRGKNKYENSISSINYLNNIGLIEIFFKLVQLMKVKAKLIDKMIEYEDYASFFNK